MPNIGAFHPQVVHFVVAGLFLGLPIYWLGFLRKPAFLRPMAQVLLLVGTVASFVAVRSGTDAHGPAERLPDTRDLVVHHEDLGKLTRNIFAGVLLLELAALALAWRAGPDGAPSKRLAATSLRVAVGVAWAVGAFQLFETAEHGGQLVYEYAGGVGYRTGEQEDIGRLLRAGLFAQSRVDREAGRTEEAARLVAEMASRYPESREVRLLAVESLILDRQDGRAALDALAALAVPQDDPRSVLRKQTYAFDAYMLLQIPDSARMALDAVPEQYRESRTVTDRRAKLGG
ncbi:MAG: hypothetical protein Q8N53_02990 [Longimicrobiales bacterium]|nr:hypothetical protein [Longimicrobiales bacterium]